MSQKRSYKKKTESWRTDYNAIPSIIPTKIYEKTDLSAGAKVFYGMLVFLARDVKEPWMDPKPVYATNYYFHFSMGRNSKYAARSIQLYIKELLDSEEIEVEFKDGHRYITPKIIPIDNTQVAAYIAPEILRDSKTSLTYKLTFGFLSWKSGNKNEYYATSVKGIADSINKSKATAYRHLKELTKLKHIKIVKNGRRFEIYCLSSRDEVVKANREFLEAEERRIIEENIKTLENAPPMSLEAEEWLNSFIGR